jgi:hypothetical protein
MDTKDSALVLSKIFCGMLRDVKPYIFICFRQYTWENDRAKKFIVASLSHD